MNHQLDEEVDEQDKVDTGDWMDFVDAGTGKTYWFNSRTQETSWATPDFTSGPKVLAKEKAIKARSAIAMLRAVQASCVRGCQTRKQELSNHLCVCALQGRQGEEDAGLDLRFLSDVGATLLFGEPDGASVIKGITNHRLTDGGTVE